MPELRVSVGKLKAHLSEYLDRAGAGTSVLITSRGKPVARLVPLDQSAAQEKRMAELVRAGLVRPALRPVDLDRVLTPGPPDPDGRALEALLDERESGW